MRLAWIGDGNNVCHSVMLVGALLGASMVVACPPGYEPDPAVQATVRDASAAGSRSRTTRSEAAAGADVLYTDVWTSMGQEAEREQRRGGVRPLPGQRAPCSASPSRAPLVMHCLPAHRGRGDHRRACSTGRSSIVLDQAENRLHAQKAVIFELLGGSLDDA